MYMATALQHIMLQAQKKQLEAGAVGLKIAILHREASLHNWIVL